jgi:hypothetical protein
VLVERTAHLVGELAVRLVASRADDPEVLGHQTRPEQAVEAGEKLTAGEVAARAEQDEQMWIRSRGFRGGDESPPIRRARQPNRSAA